MRALAALLLALCAAAGVGSTTPPPSPGGLRVTTSVSEAVDRLSILQLKARHLARPAAGVLNPAAKLRAVQTAARDLYSEVDDYLSALDAARSPVEGSPSVRPAVAALYARLLHVNHLLWDVEDVLRALEASNRTSSSDFITHARLVYVLNDRRSELKRAVDAATSSRHAEVKVYRPYTAGPLLIHGHLGLGDALVLNGLVRYKALFHSRVRVVVRRPYAATLAFLWRDHAGIELEIVDNEDHIQHGTPAREAWLGNWASSGWEVLLLGYIAAPDDAWLTKKADFAEAFYAQAGVDYSVRWSHWYVERDSAREEALYAAYMAGLAGGAGCRTPDGAATAYLQCGDEALAEAATAAAGGGERSASEAPLQLHWLNVSTAAGAGGVAGLACPASTDPSPLIAAAQPYAFLHDDPARGYVIDRDLAPVALPPGLHVVHPATATYPITCVRGGSPPSLVTASLTVHSSNLFDYSKLIESSTVFVGMDSAFALLADALLWRKLTPGALNLAVGEGFLTTPRRLRDAAAALAGDVFGGTAASASPAAAVEEAVISNDGSSGRGIEGADASPLLPHLILHVYARKTLYLDLYRAPFRFYDKTGRELVSVRKLPPGPSRFSSFVPVEKGGRDFSRIWGEDGEEEEEAGKKAGAA